MTNNKVREALVKWRESQQYYATASESQFAESDDAPLPNWVNVSQVYRDCADELEAALAAAAPQPAPPDTTFDKWWMDWSTGPESDVFLKRMWRAAQPQPASERRIVDPMEQFKRGRLFGIGIGIEHAAQIVDDSRSTDEHVNWVLIKLAERIREQVNAEEPASTGEREQLAQWMIAHSLATGHGDKFADLLNELEWQIAELRTGESGAPSSEAGARVELERENWEPHRGQYVWVEGKLTETQPSEFPRKLRVYVHGVGTGIAETVKPVAEDRTRRVKRLDLSLTSGKERVMATTSAARELAQEILKPHWPVVRNMDENEAREREVDRIVNAIERAIAKNCTTPLVGPTSSVAGARLDEEFHRWWELIKIAKSDREVSLKDGFEAGWRAARPERTLAEMPPATLKPDPHEHCVACGHERITHIPACDDLSGDDPCSCQQFRSAGGQTSGGDRAMASAHEPILWTIAEIREKFYLAGKDAPTDSYERNSALGAIDALDELSRKIHQALAENESTPLVGPKAGEGGTGLDFEAWWKSEGAEIANHSHTRHHVMKEAWEAALHTGEGGTGLREALRDAQLKLNSIILRCREGEQGTNWLPIIESIAREPMQKIEAALRSSSPVAHKETK